MIGLVRLLVVCLWVGGGSSKLQDTTGEALIRNDCVPKHWDMMTLIFSSILPTVPCHKDYRLAVQSDKSLNEISADREQVGVSLENEVGDPNDLVAVSENPNETAGVNDPADNPEVFAVNHNLVENLENVSEGPEMPTTWENVSRIPGKLLVNSKISLKLEELPTKANSQRKLSKLSSKPRKSKKPANPMAPRKSPKLSTKLDVPKSVMENQRKYTNERKQYAEENYGRLQDEEYEDDSDGMESSDGILESLEDRTYWAMKEEIIFDLVEERLSRLKKEVRIMEEYVEDYRSSTEKIISGSLIPLGTAEKRGEIVARSGIASYRMTNRFVVALQSLKELVAQDMVDTNLHDELWDSDEPSEHYNRRIAGEVYSHWPNIIDLNFAMQSLIDFQEQYELDIDELPGALADDSRFPPELNAFHCKEIGLFALYEKRYDLAVLWIEEAIRKVMTELEPSVPLASLEILLELVAYQHNEAHSKIYEGIDTEEISNSVFTDPVEPFA